MPTNVKSQSKQRTGGDQQQQLNNHGVSQQQQQQMPPQFMMRPQTSGGSMSGENTFKLPQAQVNGINTQANERPMSRGNLTGGRVQQQQHQMQNAFAISNDQQTFQLPPSQNGQPFTFTGGPQTNNSSQPPQYHFIANQQKFYAQISPDKAPLLISDKRPFTSALNANSSNGTNSSNTGTSSHNHSSSKTGRQTNHSLNKNIQMPYLQMASKTHTGSFPLQQMQMTNGSKYVSSTGQLEQPNAHQNLVSIFAQNSNQNPSMQSIMQGGNTNQHIKVSKIKPSKNNIKEKEQLYEDAIKLKIQSNSFKEENLKLKTKIKILENEMAKKEKALEDFIQKMTSLPGQSQLPQANNSYPSMFYPQQKGSNNQINNNQQQQQTAYSSTMGGNGNTFMMQSVQKIQNETFLVMSLKKQLKDQKTELQRKDEELDTLRKNIKNTQKVETDIELKTYKDELQRMRLIMEELMREGPYHPIYQKQAQDQIQALEMQRQQQEFMIQKLQIECQEQQQMIKVKDEELMKRKEEKEKKSEMKSEISKVKKTLKEKEREVLRLRQDLQTLKSTQTTTTTTTAQNSNPSSTNATSTSKQSDDTTTIKELKTLQKKVKDLTVDQKVKKEKLDEQDQVIKKLQERLQSKIDELSVEQRKVVELESKLKSIEKEKEEREKFERLINEIKVKHKNEIEKVVVKAQRDGVQYERLIEKVKNDASMSTKLQDLLKQLDTNHLRQVIPSYTLLTTQQKQKRNNQILKQLLPYKTSLKEACDLDSDDSTTLTFKAFIEALDSLDLVFSQDELNYLKVQYLVEKANNQDIWMEYKQLLQDLKEFKKGNAKGEIQNVTNNNDQVKKRERPQTAKSNKSQQQTQQQRSSQNLKQIEEDDEHDNDDHDDGEDDNYEDDFDEPINNLVKQQSTAKKDQSPNKSVNKSAINNKSVNDKSMNKSKALDKQDKVSHDDIDNDYEQEPSKPSIKKEVNHNDQTPYSDLDDIQSSQKKLKKSKSINEGKKEEEKKDELGDSNVQRFMDEEEMLDIAEHCFIRIAEILLERNKTARQVFTAFSIPEQFPNGTILELMTPIAFLEGVKEAGMDNLSEMEAACLLRVLAKPELDNAIILNEFTMIMENFGVMDGYGDEDDDIDDYIRSDDESEISKSKLVTDEDKKKEESATDKPQDGINKVDEEKKDKEGKEQQQQQDKQQPKKRKIQLNFDQLEDKGLKILQKLARFLLERYLHPREFFGPAIYKQLVKTKKRENNVDILQTKDFYLRLKIAGVRKTVKEVDNLNKFLCLDAKFPHLMQVKKVVKALEEVAMGEQVKMQEELRKKHEEEMAKGGGIIETEEGDGDIGEDEKLQKKAESEKAKIGNNQDLIRETGGIGIPSSLLTGGPSGYSGYMGGSMGGYDMGMRSALAGPSKIAMLMGFNHLNTIEEEKHETQNSNYFRDGGESERDDSKYLNNASHLLAKGSRILDELDQSGSPERHDHLKMSGDNHSQVKEEDEQEEYEEDEEEEDDNQVDQEDQADKQQNDDVIEDDNEEYVEDEDDDEPINERHDTENPRIETEPNNNQDKSIKDMKSVESDHDDEYVEEEFNNDGE